MRLVDWERTVESPYKVNAYSVAGNIINCDLPTFNNHDHIPGRNKICECTHQMPYGSVQGDGFHLTKRLTSKSILQEAWIMLLRLLGLWNGHVALVMPRSRTP